MEVGALGSVNVEELIGKENTKPCGAERGVVCRSPASRQGFVIKPAHGEPGWQRSGRSGAAGQHHGAVGLGWARKDRWSAGRSQGRAGPAQPGPNADLERRESKSGFVSQKMRAGGHWIPST